MKNLILIILFCSMAAVAGAQTGIGDYPTEVPTDADSALGAKDYAPGDPPWQTRQWPFPDMWSYFDGKMPNRVDANSAFTTNNSLIRADGAGRLIKQSPVVVDDSGNMTGVNDISPTGTVDGRDVATDGVKLDGIEDNADVTDSANVQSAGAVMTGDYGNQTILQSTTAGNPTQLTVAEQTVVGRATGGNIAALAIDNDLSTVSATDDTVPSAKAVRDAIDAIPGGGDVTGPISSTANQVPVFSDATGKQITNSQVQIDPVTGDITNANSLDLTAKPNPAMTLKDSDMPGVSKQIGGVAGQYLSGIEGAENTYNSLTALIVGTLRETGTVYNSLTLANGSFKGDLIINYNCGANINKRDVVTLQNNETNPWILANAAAAGTAYPAHGIAMSDCTVGNPVAVLIRGEYRSDSAFTGMAVGAPIYLAATNGGLTTTPPVGDGDARQIIGYKYPNNTVQFNFNRSFGNYTP